MDSKSCSKTYKLKYNVFVYGTLKKGFWNYDTYMEKGINMKKIQFVANATTIDKYPLVVSEERRVPYLLENKGIGYQIHGELYIVDATVLEALDILEGIHTGYYFRREVDIELNNSTNMFQRGFIYMKKTDEDLLNLPQHPSYTMELHQGYYPRFKYPNLKMLELICEIPSNSVEEKMEQGISFEKAWEQTKLQWNLTC